MKATTSRARCLPTPLLAFALFLAMLLALLLPTGAGAQTWRTVTTSRQTAGEDFVKVDVRYGAGRLSVGPAEGGVLYRMHLRYDEEVFEPVAEYERDHLRLGVDNIGRGIRIGRSRSSGELDLRLARDVPMELDIEFGAARADVDLGGLSLTDLELTTGASESRVEFSEPNPVSMRRATFEVGAADFAARHLGNLNAEEISVDAGVGNVVLDFTGEWRQDSDVTVDMGLGALELRVPRGLGIRINRDTFLTSFDSEGLVKRGDSYYSLDWEDAEFTVTVDVNAAFGSVEVVWVG